MVCTGGDKEGCCMEEQGAYRLVDTDTGGC